MRDSNHLYRCMAKQGSDTIAGAEVIENRGDSWEGRVCIWGYIRYFEPKTREIGEHDISLNLRFEKE